MAANTKTKSEVLINLLKGLSNEEIAEKCCITVSAVKYHVSNILKENKVKSRAQLIANMAVKQ